MVSFEADFGEYAAARWPRLFRLAYLLCGSEVEAEDVVQECLARVYERWGRVSSLDAPDEYV
jgi:DNA-directed RNA polymerase specialized sigma24 family protein